MHRLLLLPSLGRGGVRGLRTVRSFNSDRDLHLDFYSAKSQFSILTYLFSSEGWADFQRLERAGVLCLDGSFVSGMKTYEVFSTLRHPLIKRYDFEPVAFLGGAKHAFSQVHRAIASKEFAQHCNGRAGPSTHSTQALLQDTLSPQLYTACAEASRQMFRQGMDITMTDLNITDAKMYVLSVDIVAGDVPRGTEDLTDEQRAEMLKGMPEAFKDLLEEVAKVSKPNLGAGPSGIAAGAAHVAVVSGSGTAAETTVLGAEVGAGAEAAVEAVAAAAEAYLPGSVVATVEVQFKTQEEYLNHVRGSGTEPGPGTEKGTSDEGLTEFSSARACTTTWTFQGCISGQSELDWRIVAFDGMGGSPVTA